ncbi:MAG: hypothetical protein ACUVWX_08690, partial [Kiritimatiellia bacterium]
MKKVTVICQASDRHRTLEALRSLGVLHLHHVRAPTGHDVSAARQQLVQAENVLNLLATVRPASQLSRAPTEVYSADEIIARVTHLTQRRQEITEQLASLRNEEATLAPYGDFDPALGRALA